MLYTQFVFFFICFILILTHLNMTFVILSIVILNFHKKEAHQAIVILLDLVFIINLNSVKW